MRAAFDRPSATCRAPPEIRRDTEMSMSSTELCFMTARDLSAALHRGELSAREVVQAHLDQIERVNPQVNAIVTVTGERALEQARRADEHQAAGAPLGPLHGLPIAHKDNHLTAGIRTTFGSPIFADHVPTENELIIERIRDAGAITVGKTNLPEFGAGSHTFNTVFGATRNPYDLARSAGGSSGGAAAALASGMHALADGNDLGGSLRNPASFCNVVGLRPSPGRVPSHPSVTAWSSMGVSGPMGRTVGDVALLLSAIAGPDPRAPLSALEPDARFAAPLDRDLSGLRVAWSPDLGGAVPVDPDVTSTLATQISVFEKLGCVVDAACPDFSGADEAFRTLRAWQFELGLGEHLDTARELLKPAVIWNIEEGRRLSGPQVGRAERLRSVLFQRMHEFFGRYDVLLLPVSQVVPFPVEVEYPRTVGGVPQHTYLDWMRSCYYVSVTACPALSVPAGFTAGGLPVGLQIVGRHLDEVTVLQVGHAFEQATRFGGRRPPRTG
jgi:amidase